MAGGDHENPYVAIAELGWTNEGTGATGVSTRLQIYDFVTEDPNGAYVTDAQGNTALLVPRISPRGNKYVATTPDNTVNDNLLKLRECPGS
jgi:Protein of unknown function (DUF3892)